MTRRQALQEYAAIVCQIELLKLRLPPLERILLQTEMGAVKAIAKDAASKTVEQPWKRLPRFGHRKEQVFELLDKSDGPMTCMEIAAKLGVQIGIIRTVLRRLTEHGRVERIQGAEHLLYGVAKGHGHKAA